MKFLSFSFAFYKTEKAIHERGEGEFENGTFSPGWRHEPGLKGIAPFIPGSCLKPGLKGSSEPGLMPLAARTGTNAHISPGS